MTGELPERAWGDTVLRMFPLNARRVLRWFAVALWVVGGLGCVDPTDPDGGRDVFIVSVDAEVAAVGTVVRIYGRGLGAGAVVSDEADVVAGGITEDNCSVASDGDAVLFDGVSAEICFRADDRLDVRVPALSAGPHFVVVRSGGLTSNAVTVYVTQ